MQDSGTPTNATKSTLLRARGLTKSFSGVHALRGVDFDLAAGEVHALIGENGAGKSTFTKIVTGIIARDSGELEICGHSVQQSSPDYASSLGVAAIYQQPSLFPHLTVAENIALALKQDRSNWKIDWKARAAQSRSLTEQLGAKINPNRLAGSLSMAEQQIVEIAKAIGAKSKILFMDEPTALLSQLEVDNLFRIVRELRAQGVGIVYISHRLDEILEIADRITVLRDGQTIGTRDASSVSRDELISLMVGRSVASIFPKRDVPIRDTVLSVSNLSCRTQGLHNISFSVRSGEILGFSGLVGSGRTELARTLFGMIPTDTTVSLNGEPVQITSPRQAIELAIGYLPEDRRQHGLILDMAIAANVSMASLQTVSRRGLLNRSQEDTLAADFVSRLRIKTSSISAPAMSLSGGNQQKVALARWLAIKPRIMILDEPTQGVDVGSKAEIHEIICQMAQDGVAIILISSELPEIIGMCDRIAVFHNKTIAGTLSRHDATQETIMALAFGHPTNNSNTTQPS